MKSSQKNLADSLAKLYVVIMALALGRGVQRATDMLVEEHIQVPHLIVIALSLLAFTMTVIPYYHGTKRHWYHAYSGSRKVDSGIVGLHIDFYGALGHALLLFTMASFITHPVKLFLTFMILLVTDVIVVAILSKKLYSKVSLFTGIKGIVARALGGLSCWLDSQSNVISKPVGNPPPPDAQRLLGWITVNVIILGLVLITFLIFWFGPDKQLICTLSDRNVVVGGNTYYFLYGAFILLSVIRSILDYAVSKYGRVPEKQDPEEPGADSDGEDDADGGDDADGEG